MKEQINEIAPTEIDIASKGKHNNGHSVPSAARFLYRSLRSCASSTISLKISLVNEILLLSINPQSANYRSNSEI